MSDPRVVIRPATASDAGAVGRVHFLAWQQTYTDLVPDSIMSRLSEERSTALFRREGCRDLFVALLNGEVVGFCGYGPWRGKGGDCDAGEVFGLYVLQKAQGLGIGAGLLRAALDVLRSRGYASAALWVLDSNARAIGFYRAQGFADTGITYDDGPLREQKMELCLSPGSGRHS